MSKIQGDLQTLCGLAKELGATNAVSFKAKDVIVDERVRLKCMIPPCDDYGLNLMCPPYVLSVQEFRDVLSKFDWAILIQIEAPITPKMKKEIQETNDVAGLYKSNKFMDIYKKVFDPAKSKVFEIVNKIEAKASMLGYPFATGFKAGSCNLCPECVVLDSKRTCRHPYRSRPSMEAVGIDVFKTAENAGLAFDMPPKEKAIWNGLVLIN
jgi:predicted metal-binding protein